MNTALTIIIIKKKKTFEEKNKRDKLKIPLKKRKSYKKKHLKARAQSKENQTYLNLEQQKYDHEKETLNRI